MRKIGLLAAAALLAVPTVASARRVATPRETTAMRAAILRDFHPGSPYRVHGYVVSTSHTAPSGTPSSATSRRAAAEPA